VRPLAQPLVLAAALVAALALAGAAGAAGQQAGKGASACGNALIRDWYDGRIDKTYAVHCYQDALKHLPDDVRTYSDAYDVISRALADATRGKKNVDPDTPIPPPTDGGGSTTTTTPGGGTGPGTGGGGDTNASGGPIGGVLTSGDQGSDGVPIPLLVLGGLALLLVAAGAAGLLTRRIQARRARP
jgi:hypothetical protein